MSTEIQTEPMVRFSKLSTQGWVLGLYPSQLATLGLSVLFAVMLGSRDVQLLLYASPFLLLNAVISIIRKDGIPLWALFTRLGVLGLRKRLGKTRMVASGKPVKDAKLDLPGRAGLLEFWSTTEGAALLYDPIDRTVTAVAEVIADATFELLPITDKHEAMSKFATFLASFKSRQAVVKIALQERTYPATQDVAMRHFEDVLAVRGVAKDSIAATNYRQVLSALDGRTVAHRNLIAVTFSVAKMDKTIKLLGRGMTAVVTATVAEMRATTNALEEAGFPVKGWLNVRQYAALGRVAFDPAFTEFIDERAGSEFEGVDPVAIGAIDIEERRNLVVTDSAVHRSWWIHEWPRTEVRAGFLAPVILDAGIEPGTIAHIFTLVAASEDSSHAIRRIESDKKNWRSRMSTKQSRGHMPTEADKADWDALVEAEEAIINGASQLKFSGYLTLTAPSESRLEEAATGLQSSMTQAGLEPRILYGRQVDALMLAAIPTGRGL